MYLRAAQAIKLHGARVASSAAGTEVDLQKYYVNPGKREMKATVQPILSGSDSGTFVYKLQESLTTVDSDFSDISGATTSTLADSDSPFDVQSIHFYTNKRFVRGYVTLSAGAYFVAATLFAVKRDA
jgi:hypothetical protein